MHNAAIESGNATSFGTGTASAVVVSETFEIGGVYGPNGTFGCYVTTCIGGTTDVEGGIYVAAGLYLTYDVFRGQSIAIVEEAGEILVFFTSQILNTDGDLIGTADGLSLEASILPVAVGVYDCATIVDTVGMRRESDGVLIPVDNSPPTALCKHRLLALVDTSIDFAAADINNGSIDPDGDPITITQIPSGPYPIGKHEVMLEVVDPDGASDSCTGVIEVLNRTWQFCNTDEDCDDGIFCNGQEECLRATGNIQGETVTIVNCQHSTNPCPSSELCDEEEDICLDCLEDAHCDDGLFCNGQETCRDETCEEGSNPCLPDELCDEENDSCAACFTDNECDDGLYCNGKESCVDGNCIQSENPCIQGTTCNEENDECIPTQPAPLTVDIIPSVAFRSHILQLPLVLFVSGSETSFDDSTTVSFSDDVITALWITVLSPELISTFSLISAAGIDTSGSSEIEVIVTTDDGTGIAPLTLITLPGILGK